VNCCADAAWTLRVLLRNLLTECELGCCATAARTLRNLRPYFLIRGWCLSEIFRFSISENRPHSRSTERVKLRDDGRSERPFLKSERTQRLWSRGILEADVDCAAV